MVHNSQALLFLVKQSYPLYKASRLLPLAIHLHLLAAKGAGQGEALSEVSLDLDFDKAFAQARVGAYERLLLDAIAGRLNLFVRSDEQEQAWRWVEPILQAWRRDDESGSAPRPYAAGTWGPAAASALVAREGFAWSEEQ
jgi:glucose-6-phosphate 1-dehydrogenase